MERIKIICNPLAGGGVLEDEVVQGKNYFARQGCSVELHYSQSPGHAARLAGEFALEAYEKNRPVVLAMVGGDGAVACAANGILPKVEEEPEIADYVRIGIIPFGTGNVLAQKLGILSIPDKFIAHKQLYRARNALNSMIRHVLSILGLKDRLTDPNEKFYRRMLAGKTKGIDTLEIAYRGHVEYSFNWTGYGLSGNLISNVDEKLKKSIKEPAFLDAARKSAQGYKPNKLRVTIEPGTDQEETYDCFSVDVGKNEMYGGPGFKYFKGARLDDGLLHVNILPDPRLFDRINTKDIETELFTKKGYNEILEILKNQARLARLVSRVLVGQHYKSPDLINVRAKRVKIEPLEDILGHVDCELREAKRGEIIEVSVGRQLNVLC